MDTHTCDRMPSDELEWLGVQILFFCSYICWKLIFVGRSWSNIVINFCVCVRACVCMFQCVFLREVFELSNYVDRSQLPASLGGYFIYSHESWVSFIKVSSVSTRTLLLRSRAPRYRPNAAFWLVRRCPGIIFCQVYVECNENFTSSCWCWLFCSTLKGLFLIY